MASHEEEEEEEKEECCGSGACCSAGCHYCWDDSQNKFPPVRSFFLIGAFLFYILDVALDVWVAYEHYLADQAGTDSNARYYFQATVFLIVFPLVMINALSWGLYTWGWLVYRSRMLKSYCESQTEPLVYVELGRDRETHAKHVPVKDVGVISWSWYDKSRKRKAKLLRSLSSGAQNSTRKQDPLFLSLQTSQHSNIRKPSQSQRETKFVNRSLSADSAKRYDRDNEEFDRRSRDFILRDESDSTAGQDETDSDLKFYPLDLLDTSEYLCVSLLHLLQLGYTFRVLRLFYKRKQDRYSFDRYKDISFLRLMESFLESAPQLVLQLYVVILREEGRLVYNIITPISIVVSMCSLALAVGDYISATKDLNYYDPPPNHERKPRLSWTAYFIIIFWHLFMIASRGIAFALFAAIYGRYIFLIVGVHYVAMVYWMYWRHAHVFVNESATGDQSKQKCYNKRSLRSCIDPRNHICSNYGIEFVVAVFNTFFHFKIKQGGSFQTLVPFYVITFAENALMILLWYCGRDFRVDVWYAIPAPLAVFGCFAVGLSLLGIYYACFRPESQATLQREPGLDHPTMTCTLNRLYRVKELRGNLFQRIMTTSCRQQP